MKYVRRLPSKVLLLLLILCTLFPMTVLAKANTLSTVESHEKMIATNLNNQFDHHYRNGLVWLESKSFMEWFSGNIVPFLVGIFIVIISILIFAVINLKLRLKAEKDREEVRNDLQRSYLELEATHMQLIAGESELNRQFKELQMKEDELRKSRERYRLAAKGSEFGIWDYDIETGVLYFSNKAKELLGLEIYQESFELEDVLSLLDEEQRHAFEEAIDQHLSMKRVGVEYNVTLLIHDKKEWISVRGKAQFNKENVAIRLAGSLTCITSEKEAQKKIIQIAYTDELTGLNNKAYLNEQLCKSCEDEACDNAALMLIDLDNFKTVNDSLGHSYGDEVLKKVAILIGEEVDGAGKIIRFGGDEFIVVITNFDCYNEINQLAQKLLDRFRNGFDINGIGFFNTLSIGIAVYPEDSLDMGLLLKHGDLALNEAKARGRNQYVYYNKTIEEVMNHHLWYERELKRAVEEEEFELYYQPKFNLREDKISGFEALIRWNHPEKGLIQPSEFIPIAEESGLIIKIGEWVMKEAIYQLDQWHQLGHTHLTMAINLSAKQFKEVNLQEAVNRAIKGKKVATHHIEFEITETTALHDIKSAVKTLDELRQQGYRFALDDFGTGYSSLNYLNILPMDTLKIDKTFIGKSIYDELGSQIIKTVIQLAHIYNLDVVAEGVETALQLDLLREEQCDMIQGYFISKPVRAEEAIAMVEESFELIESLDR